MQAALSQKGIDAVLADVERGDIPIALGDLPEQPFCPRRGGKKFSIQTAFRWAQVGKLEVARIGGVLCTTRAAFLRAASRASGASPSDVRTPGRRDRAVDAADAELAAAGL